MSERAETGRPRKTAVVGAGNLLMADEGIGVRVVQALEREPLPAGVALFDAGTALFALTAELSLFDKLIVVDAVRGGELPGTIYRLELEEVLRGRQHTASPESGSAQDLGLVSLHDLGVVETLMLERFADRVSPGPRASNPTEVVILGIEPEKIELSLELSPTLEHKLPLLLEALFDELEWTPSPSLGKKRVHTLNEEEPS